jgi:hypothetical protein
VSDITPDPNLVVEALRGYVADVEHLPRYLYPLRDALPHAEAIAELMAESAESYIKRTRPTRPPLVDAPMLGREPAIQALITAAREVDASPMPGISPARVALRDALASLTEQERR